MARSPEFDLAKELGKPSFTPAARDAAALVELIVGGDDLTVTRAAPALAGLRDPARLAILARLAGPAKIQTTDTAAAIPDAPRDKPNAARTKPDAARDKRDATRNSDAVIPEPVSLDDGGAARLVSVLGLLARAGDPAARAVLIARLGDPATRVRRACAVALGKLAASGGKDAPGRRADRAVAAVPASGAPIVELREGERRNEIDRREAAGEPVVELREVARRADADRRDELDDVRAALLARWDAADVTPDERRALAEALGKVGGEAAMARLQALDPSTDKELERRRDRAVLIADRTSKRGEDSTIATDVVPSRPLTVRLGCRPGLGELLYAELVKVDLGGEVRTQQRTDAVDVTLTRPWSALFASRLWATAAIRVPLAGLPERPRGAPVDGGDRADADAAARAIAAAVTAPEIRDLLHAWTRGPIRWRLAMAKGHQRAVVWTVAKEVTRIAPELINDPTATTWEIVADLDEQMLELVPRRIDDPRFAYRDADVPAASHPSVAAALAWVAEARSGDRVWDPFCGSGIELVERARRGPYRTLLGTDLEETALAAARTNLHAAGVTAELVIADARTHNPGAVDLILTNPPLGSRVRVDAAALLVAALPGFARQLSRGGRLVWITPAHRKTTPAAEECGLVLARSMPVDLGGVRGRLERWDKKG